MGWDLTENQRVKQINSYPILSDYLQNCQPEAKPSRIPFFHFYMKTFIYSYLKNCCIVENYLTKSRITQNLNTGYPKTKINCSLVISEISKYAFRVKIN